MWEYLKLICPPHSFSTVHCQAQSWHDIDVSVNTCLLHRSWFTVQPPDCLCTISSTDGCVRMLWFLCVQDVNCVNKEAHGETHRGRRRGKHLSARFPSVKKPECIVVKIRLRSNTSFLSSPLMWHLSCTVQLKSKQICKTERLLGLKLQYVWKSK